MNGTLAVSISAVVRRREADPYSRIGFGSPKAKGPIARGRLRSRVRFAPECAGAGVLGRPRNGLSASSRGVRSAIVISFSSQYLCRSGGLLP